MNSSEKSSFQKVRFRFLIPIGIILLVSTTSLLYSFYKRSDKNDIILKMTMQLVREGHVSPVPINSQFSEKAFDAYMKNLDPLKWFLTKEDIKQMEVYRRQIGEQLNAGTYQLFDLSVKIMEKRISETQGYYKEILSQPFDFSVDEMWEIDHEKREWPDNSAELKENWRKMMKRQSMSHVSNALRVQENQTDSSKIKTMEAIEIEARERWLKYYNDQYNNLDHKQPDKMFGMYVNAIMTVFDPHTKYQTARQKENFDINMTGQLEGIGASLVPSDGYVSVQRIIIGSPSWLQGELRVNDHITKVKQEHEEEAVDIFGWSVDDAVTLIRGKKGTKVTLTVRRIDGSIHEITITRDLVIDEETYAKSAILNDHATKTKAGYIYLPSFYLDFKRSATGRAASEDVAEEIEKLKKDGVHGIILDMRTNGGGALFDVINMGGLFVPQGPIVQVKASAGPARAQISPFPSERYDGPLVVLVNAVSASASEILAAALQDYKRAVIIGDPQTYGKGTVQHVIDLDEWLPAGLSAFKPMGAFNLTFQKFYRITGGSVQLKGVESDITLPDVYSALKYRARFDDNHLEWSTVPAARFNEWKNPVNIDVLKKKSAERTSKSEDFKLLSQQIAQIKEQYDNTYMTLNLNVYQQEDKKRREENKRFEEFNKKTTALDIAATTVDIAEMKGDTARIARSDRWIKDMTTDIILEEAVKVIGDMR